MRKKGSCAVSIVWGEAGQLVPKSYVPVIFVWYKEHPLTSYLAVYASGVTTWLLWACTMGGPGPIYAMMEDWHNYELEKYELVYTAMS